MADIKDWDFIKGKINISFYPQGGTGYFEIEKEGTIRKFPLEKYFELDAEN